MMLCSTISLIVSVSLVLSVCLSVSVCQPFGVCPSSQCVCMSGLSVCIAASVCLPPCVCLCVYLLGAYRPCDNISAGVKLDKRSLLCAQVVSTPQTISLHLPHTSA